MAATAVRPAYTTESDMAQRPARGRLGRGERLVLSGHDTAGASRGGVLPSQAAHPRASPPPLPLYRDGSVLLGATLSPSLPPTCTPAAPCTIPSSQPCSCRPKIVQCARSLADARRSMLAGLDVALDRLVGRTAGVGHGVCWSSSTVGSLSRAMVRDPVACIHGVARAGVRQVVTLGG